MDSFRAFFAVGLPQQLRREITVIINSFKLGSRGIVWSKSDNLHITMRFLGNIRDDMSQRIVAGVSKSVREMQPFVVNLSSLIMLPSSKNPKVIALKPESCEQLIKLNLLVEKVLRQCDIQSEEHTFVPHVTIGRIKNRFILAGEAIKLPETKFTVNEVALYRSDRNNDETIYTSLVSCSIGII